MEATISSARQAGTDVIYVSMYLSIYPYDLAYRVSVALVTVETGPLKQGGVWGGPGNRVGLFLA